MFNLRSLLPAIALLLCGSAALADGWYWTGGSNLQPLTTGVSVSSTQVAPAGRITTATAGDLKWTSHAFTLPGGATVDSVAVACRVSDAATAITQVRLVTQMLPTSSTVWFDQAVSFNSTTGTAGRYAVPFRPSTDRAVAIQLRGNFASTTHSVDVGAIGVYLHFTGYAAEAPPPSTSSGRLEQNRPNPFNPSTVISFDLPQGGPVRLQVFDLEGALVATLVDDALAAGPHEATWNGCDVHGRAQASGAYVYRLESATGVETRSMMLLK